jgi:DNA-binding NtrC family response regulator
MENDPMSSENEAGRPARILVIEDDISISRLIGLAMPELGIPYVFVGALSAEEGLELWEKEPFDLLLTDYNLPGMRGTELIAILKSRGVTAPMVLFTAYDSPKLAREVRKLGVAAYIAKPFLMEDMLDTIRRLIDTRVYSVNG